MIMNEVDLERTRGNVIFRASWISIGFMLTKHDELQSIFITMSRRGNKACINSFMHDVFSPFLYSS